jgi:hypothetical protein
LEQGKVVGGRRLGNIVSRNSIVFPIVPVVPNVVKKTCGTEKLSQPDPAILIFINFRARKSHVHHTSSL